jgi:hypothetical protein
MRFSLSKDVGYVDKTKSNCKKSQKQSAKSARHAVKVIFEVVLMEKPLTTQSISADRGA